MRRRLAPLVIFFSVASAAFECTFDIASYHFNLSPLQGVHTTSKITQARAPIENITVYIDLCQDLKWDSSFDPSDRCDDGTRVCVIKSQRDEKKTITEAISTAGELGQNSLNANKSLIHSTTPDEKVEGVRIEFQGETYENIQQRTVIKLNCDSSEDVGTPHFTSFTEGILRLDWKTRWACPELINDDSRQQSNHWGFMTWLIIIVFMVIATYVIYSAFLNYSRYGVRSGWDLLPHSDTLRDLPYLIKDFASHVVSTVKGGGYRGGYSAV